MVACWTGFPPDMRQTSTNAVTSGRISIFSSGEASGRSTGGAEIERTLESVEQPRDIDRERALREVQQVILKLRPLDRQIIISYLEGMDAASIADITGLTPANIAMKIHRIKKILAHRIREEQSHA